MGKHSVDLVPLNIHKFIFRVLTLKEIYKTIDILENSKSPGPGFVHAWALKAAKYATVTQLQLIFNECIQNSVFPTVLKHAYVTPIHKKGQQHKCATIDQFGSHQLLLSFLRSFSFSK